MACECAICVVHAVGGGAGPADDTASVNGATVEIPKRKTSLSRQPSLTKGFL